MPPLTTQRISRQLRKAINCVMLFASTMGLSIGDLKAQTQQVAAETGATSGDASTPGIGPIRLRQPAPTTEERNAAGPANLPPAQMPAYTRGEFERFVASQASQDVRRFGSELVSGSFDSRGTDLSPMVPGDYLVASGDEILLTLWGSIDADLHLTVDRAGRISIPRVGTVQVSGVRYADLQDVVVRRIGQTFKNFQANVSLGQLRAIRVFVTGFVVKPGTYTVTSLSTVLSSLMRAGGPAASGSFRQIELRRGNSLLSTIDLYDLLLKGDRSKDAVVQAGDVIHVGPIGVQVGVIGSVNRPTILELKPGETVADALRVAGGLSAVADRSRLAIERLVDRAGTRVAQLTLPTDMNAPLANGDVIRAFSAVEVTLASGPQRKRIRIEGEVVRPADYVLPETSTIADALRAAGGLTANAYLFAAEFNRETVRRTQQENFDRALRDLETDFARATVTQRATSPEEMAIQASRAASTSRLIERLRALKPSGRIMLGLAPEAQSMPDLALEDGDRIYIPPRPTTVGVFGSVFNAANYLYRSDGRLGDYLRLAGGATKGADEESVFVIRANGNVVSNRQSSSMFSRTHALDALQALPGDTLFVPEELNKTTFIQNAKDWTQILYQLGIGAAGIMSAIR